MKITETTKTTGLITITTTDKHGRVKRTQTIKNLVMVGTNTGVGLVTQRLAGSSTTNIEINKASFGTGTTAPTVNDTDLETPVTTDIPKAKAISTADKVSLDFFVPSADLPDGTYNEFGIFSDSNLFARAIISPPYVKGADENTSIHYEITFTTS